MSTERKPRTGLRVAALVVALITGLALMALAGTLVLFALDMEPPDVALNGPLVVAGVGYGAYLLLQAVAAVDRVRTRLLGPAALAWWALAALLAVDTEGSVSGWLLFGLVGTTATLVVLAAFPVDTPATWLEFLSGVALAACGILTSDEQAIPFAAVALVLFGVTAVAAPIAELVARRREAVRRPAS